MMIAAFCTCCFDKAALLTSDLLQELPAATLNQKETSVSYLASRVSPVQGPYFMAKSKPLRASDAAVRSVTNRNCQRGV